MHLSVILFLGLPLARAWWVGLESLTYKEAEAACSPGALATFSTNQELSNLLQTNQKLRTALASTNQLFFWIGLEKPKNLCVVPDQDQRGFRFVDNRQDSELSIWREEPRDTCTNVRCGAVALGSGSWGLVSRSCKNKNSFICGPPESGSRPEFRPETRPKSTPETRPESRPESRPEGPAGTRDPNREQTRLSPVLVPDPGLEPKKSPDPGPPSEPDQKGPTSGPEPGLVSESESSADPGTDYSPVQDLSPTKRSVQVPGQHLGQTDASAIPSLDPGPGPGLRPGPSSGPGSSPGLRPGPSSGPGSSPGLRPGPSDGPGSSPGLPPGPSSGPSCSLPLVPGSRFLYDSEPGQVSVECWSGEILLLRCVHGVWTRTRPDSGPDPDPSSDPDLDPDSAVISGSGLNHSEVWSGVLRCSDCGPGLRFKDGECDDIDECSLSPGPCAHGCVNNHGSFTCTPSPLSHALVHSLIAVAAVTLAVIAVVTIWCCLRKKRRDQKQDQDQDLNHNQTEV